MYYLTWTLIKAMSKQHVGYGLLLSKHSKHVPNCLCSSITGVQLWQYRLWSFQMGDTKFERFLPNNQHTQRKLLNFELTTNDELSKSAKI